MGSSLAMPGQATITPVYWAAPGYSFTSTYKSIVNGYLQDVSLDSARRMSTNAFAVANQYYQQDFSTGAMPRHIQYHVAEGAELDDSSAYPSGGCTPATGFTACVSDAALQAELTATLKSSGLPLDDSHLYLAMFPTGVETCEPPDSNNVTKCSASDYCAYHSSSAAAPYLIYANEPMPDLPSCSDPINGPQAPNGDAAADAEVSLISHEANEAITDWAGAWMDVAQFENGDECQYVYGTPQGVAGAFYNQVIGRGRYYTQDEFSNEDFHLGIGDSVNGAQVAGCIQQEELPTASFANGMAVSATTTVLDASSSSDPDGGSAPLMYTWIWDDGTPISAGVKPSHFFCSPGSHSVRLDVTDGDGWQASTTQSLQVTQGRPVVTQLTTSSGPSMGGTSVSIQGCSFTGVTGVQFGSAAASGLALVSDQDVTATAPAAAPGYVDVTVTTSQGSSAPVAGDRFTYANWTSLGGILTSGPAESSWGRTHTDVFVAGGDGQLYHNWFNGTSWQGFQPLGGSLASDPAAVSWGPNRIDVFARGSDGQLLHTWWDGSTWNSWQPLGGSLASGPDVSSWAPNRLDVFMRGTDNQLWHTWWDGAQWNGWQPLGGQLASDPAAVSWVPNRIDVFAKGMDNQLWHTWWDGTRWNPWQPLGGLLTSGPEAASCAPGHLDVVVLGGDSSIYQLGYDGTSWAQWKRIGGAWSGDPGAVCISGTNAIAAFVRGRDNALWYEVLSAT